MPDVSGKKKKRKTKNSVIVYIQYLNFYYSKSYKRLSEYYIDE